MGNVIAQRDIEKVFPADEYSAVGIAGTAGLAVEMVKLFQLELEHFEKVEGAQLSLEGKANRLSTIIRSRSGDGHAGPGRGAVVRRAMTWTARRAVSSRTPGGRSEEQGFAATGSGSVFARSALKKLFQEDFTENQAATAVVQALDDAATTIRRPADRTWHGGSTPSSP